jgi:diadenosine tetraphosphate (Ap4A) HIT family hydrolase
LLLPDPVVPDLNALAGDDRARFLRDMSILGDAVLEVTGCARINYEILGNLEPALHAHVIPRYADEPDTHRTRPIWFYDFATAPPFDPNVEAHQALVHQLKQAIEMRLRNESPFAG